MISIGDGVAIAGTNDKEIIMKETDYGNGSRYSSNRNEAKGN